MKTQKFNKVNKENIHTLQNIQMHKRGSPLDSKELLTLTKQETSEFHDQFYHIGYNCYVQSKRAFLKGKSFNLI